MTDGKRGAQWEPWWAESSGAKWVLVWGTELAISLAEGRGLAYSAPLLQSEQASERCSARSSGPATVKLMLAHTMANLSAPMLAHTMANLSAPMATLSAPMLGHTMANLCVPQMGQATGVRAAEESERQRRQPTES
jgi:hypothetical protein